MPTDTDDLLTTAQAAEVLGVTVRTVARWADSGRLTPAVEFPGLRGPRMFRQADVLALMEQRSA